MMLHTTNVYVRTYVSYNNMMSFIRTYVTYENVYVMSEGMINTNTRCILSELKLQQKCNTAEHMFHTNMRCILSELKLQQKCNISEHMLDTEILCIVSELMIYTKMCYVRTYIPHEYELCSAWTYVRYENVICPNLWYTQKYDILCLNLCYIQKCNMSEHMLLTKIWWLVSELMMHTKMCNVWTYVPNEYEICSVRTKDTYENM